MTRIRRIAAPAICFASLGVLSFSSSALAAYSSEFGSYTQSNINYVDSTHQQYGEWSEAATYFDKSDHWGNSDFNAGYRVFGYSSAAKNPKTVWTYATGALTTDVTIFGNTSHIIDVYATGNTNARPATTNANMQVLLKGYTVYSPSTTSGTSWSWSQPLFSAEWSKKFWVAGWLPVRVSAKVTGVGFANYNVRLNPTYMRAGMGGGGGLYAQARGDVGESWLLGASAWANLTLVEPSVDFSAVQSWDLQSNGSNCNVTFWKGINGALTVKALGGNVKAQGQAFTGTYTDTIFSWSGFTNTYPLFPSQMTAKTATDPIPCPTVGG